MERTALVTGASRGIGYELARRLGERGRDLVLVARSGDQLREHARRFSSDFGVDVRVEPVDLADPEGPDVLLDRLAEQGIAVHTLVNNAGFGLHGRFVEQDVDVLMDMLRLNVRALTKLSRQLLPRMVDRGDGALLNVASTAAFFPGPYMGVYYSTKSYVVSLTESLAHELKGTGVRVSVLCPGPTDTDFMDRSRLGESGFLEKVPRVADPGEVAEFGLRKLDRNQTLALEGWSNWIMVHLGRFLPRSWLGRLVTLFQPPPGTAGEDGEAKGVSEESRG